MATLNLNPPGRWTIGDSGFAAGWFALAVAARLPLTARAEGLLDHDQSVVGLMALDIAAGRRFPVFFDGQRYMGALEAYTAAGFVRVFGHAPAVVALAPLLVFGLLVAAQFAVWTAQSGRRAGHLAALFTVVCAPLLTVWGLIPRGGYVEILAWSVPTLVIYRAVVRPGRPGLTAAQQAGWGCWLGLGHVLNPLSMTVYVTLGLDWTFGRHGLDLRARRLDGRPTLERWATPFGWAAAGLATVASLAFFCHVDPRQTENGTPYVYLAGLATGPAAAALGAAGVVLILGALGYATRLPGRLVSSLAANPWVLLGLAVAWSPYAIYAAQVRAGTVDAAPTLPAWIGAPWNAGRNLRYAVHALPTLIGSDPRAVASVLVGQGVEPPPAAVPALNSALIAFAPVATGLAAFLVVSFARSLRWDLRRRAALRDEAPGSLEFLAVTHLGVTLGLYLLQGTSPNASSIRYLVMAWVALPGILALSVCRLRTRPVMASASVLALAWGLSQYAIYRDAARPAPARRLADELTRRGVPAVVAPTPVALIVANLSHGRVGAVEYQAIWPRLGRRYLDRLNPSGPITCVVDTRFPWAIDGEGAWAPAQDLGRHLKHLAEASPGRVRHVWTLDGFEVWEADLPLELLLEPAERR